MKKTGSQIIMEVLLEQNVDTVFGYPGGTVLNIYDALYQYSDRIHHVLSVHEQGAAHAADGYARATGKVGVCIATSGPGATNLVTGIATAYMDSSPMVAITGNVPTGLLGRDSFQEIDITGVTMPITKHNFIVKEIKELAPTLRKAFKIANSGRKGPVLIDVPKDITAQEYEYEPLSAQQIDEVPMPKDKCTRRAVELLKNAERPLIYMGGGAILSDASNELIAFAQKQDIPVVASMMGLGAFPCDHPLYVGLIGMHGLFEANKAAYQSDVLVVCGARFSDRVAGNRSKFAPNSAIIHIDVDGAEMDKNVYSEYHLHGDLKGVLQLLNKELPANTHTQWKEEIGGWKRPITMPDFPGYATPQRVIETVDTLTGDDAIIVTDVGQHQMWTVQYYQFKQPRTLVTSGGLGTMGFSMGAAMGAKFGQKDRRVVMFAGDGGFHMNLNELATMASYQIPVVMIVMNNTVLGMVRQWQKLFYENRFSSTSPQRHTDFVKVAQAFGIKGMKIASNDEIETVLKAAFAENGPVLVEVKISPDANVLPMIPSGGSHTDTIDEM